MMEKEERPRRGEGFCSRLQLLSSSPAPDVDPKPKPAEPSSPSSGAAAIGSSILSCWLLEGRVGLLDCCRGRSRRLA